MGCEEPSNFTELMDQLPAASPLDEEIPIDADGPVIEDAAPAPVTKPPRLLSLDAFRGLTICMMLLVNNVALDRDTPPQLLHAKWNLGLHVADVVFPWFLFCVGVAIPYSRAAFFRNDAPWSRYIFKATVRAAVLVGLGCLVDSAINQNLAFSLGVLQLIGLAYWVAAMVNELPTVVRITFASVLLAGYGWAILNVPFADAPAGVFEEGRNLIQHVNDTYLRPYRLQGLLSAVPTAALALYGTLIGDILRQPRDGRRWRNIHKLGLLVGTGLALVAAGDLLSVVLPYNKPVWTPSYIIACGGLGAVALGLCYLIVDIGRQKWIAYPFLVFGSNAIVAYVVPVLVKVLVFQMWQVETPGGMRAAHTATLEWLKGNYGNVPGGWAYTGGYIVLWWIVLWVLYRKRWFLKV